MTEYAFDPGFYIESALRLTEPYTPDEISEFPGR